MISIILSQPGSVITFAVDVWPENSCGSAGSVKQTSDGGYLFAGWVGIVKVDSSGTKEWKNQSHPSGMGTYPYYEDIIYLFKNSYIRIFSNEKLILK